MVPNLQKIGAVMVSHQTHAVAAFAVEVRHRTPGVVTVGMSGEFDQDTGAAAERMIMDLLRAERPARLALDLSQVTFIGSYGIRVLLTCHQTAEQLGCMLGISQAHERVRRVLTMTDLDDVLILPADG